MDGRFDAFADNSDCFSCKGIIERLVTALDLGHQPKLVINMLTSAGSVSMLEV